MPPDNTDIHRIVCIPVERNAFETLQFGVEIQSLERILNALLAKGLEGSSDSPARAKAPFSLSGPFSPLGLLSLPFLGQPPSVRAALPTRPLSCGCDRRTTSAQAWPESLIIAAFTSLRRSGQDGHATTVTASLCPVLNEAETG